MTTEMPTNPDFLRSLEARVIKARQEREDKLGEESERRRLRHATARALREMAYGTDAMPIGDVFHDKIRIAPTDWARLITQAVRALAAFPGLEVVRKTPIRVEGLGYEAAAHVWDVALAGAAESDVASILGKSLEVLGYYDGWPWSNPSHRDSSNAFWGYFKQLESMFDGSQWLPCSVILGADSKPKAVPSVANPTAAPVRSAAETQEEAFQRRNLTETQKVRAREVLRRLAAYPGDKVPRNALRSSIGLPPQSLDKYLDAHAKRSKRHGGGAELKPVSYDRDVVQQYVALHWSPKA